MTNQSQEQLKCSDCGSEFDSQNKQQEDASKQQKLGQKDGQQREQAEQAPAKEQANR